MLFEILFGILEAVIAILRVTTALYDELIYLDFGSIPDWIAAIAAIITTGIAAYLGFVTLAQQRKSGDIQLSLGIFSSINDYWDRIVDSDNKNYNYNMGQILAHFETAAMLFNNTSLSNGALPILKDHIIEVFSQIQSSEEGVKLMDACRSSPETFKELRLFATRHMPEASKILQQCDEPPSGQK